MLDISKTIVFLFSHNLINLDIASFIVIKKNVQPIQNLLIISANKNN